MFRIPAHERAFSVAVIGEYGIDAGGLYRACFETCCAEMESPALPLFVACPNAREGIGMNRDKFGPRPSSTKPIHIICSICISLRLCGNNW